MLAYATGPEAGAPRFVFAALDETVGYEGRARAVQRNVVVLEGSSAFTFDLVAGVEPETRWRMGAGSGLRLLAPEGSEGGFLAAFAPEGELVRGVDLARGFGSVSGSSCFTRIVRWPGRRCHFLCRGGGECGFW